MKKVLLIIAIIVSNMFYYNICHYTDGSILILSSAEKNDEVQEYEMIVHALSIKKVAYIKLIDDDRLCFLVSNTKITMVMLDQEELDSLNTFMHLRQGIVQEKTLYVGIGSILAIILVLGRRKR